MKIIFIAAGSSTRLGGHTLDLPKGMLMINGNSIISTLLKEQETFSIPNENGLIISASNAGSIKIKNGDTLSDEIGSFGTILNSVSLDSLLNKY